MFGITDLRKHLSTVVVAFVAGTIGASVPAVAHGVKHALFAHNAGKVDGKSAVSSSTPLAQRGDKLVATDPATGLLPNDIIALAPDADLLDGLNSSAFATSDHNHDASYYTKTQVDAAVSAAGNDAWAYVISNGGLHASSGNVTVTKPAMGEYCVVVDKRASHKAAQVTLADPDGNKIVSVGTGHGSACNPLVTPTNDVVPVYVVTQADAPVDGNFTIFIPAP